MNVLEIALTSYIALLGTLVGWLTLRRIDRLEAKVDRLPTREEFDARVGRLEVQTDGLRTDLTQVALAVGARPRPQIG